MNKNLGLTPVNVNQGYKSSDGLFIFPHVYTQNRMYSSGTISFKNNLWIWVDVEESLSRYLRRLFLRGHGIKLQKPSWDDHITVVSSHEKSNINIEDYIIARELFEGRDISFTIELNLTTNGNAYWYPVISHELDHLREYIGLKNPREIPLHFAIGYLTEGKIELE